VEASATPPAAAVASASASASAPVSLVREERDVVVAGKKERWRLEWQAAPTYDCFQWSCPCEGVRYGERGPLTLVRAREGAAEQRLDLGERALQRWPVLEADGLQLRPSIEETLPLIRERPVVGILQLGDYDHDGREAEFVLDRGSYPCGAHAAIVIGAFGKDDALGILSVAGHPDLPIVLNGRSQWETLRRAGAAELARGVELKQYGCGNHGSGEEVAYIVRRTAAGFGVTVRRYLCDASFKRRDVFQTTPYTGPTDG
jgi:hypothetical protein